MWASDDGEKVQMDPAVKLFFFFLSVPNMNIAVVELESVLYTYNCADVW